MHGVHRSTEPCASLYSSRRFLLQAWLPSGFLLVGENPCESRLGRRDREKRFHKMGDPRSIDEDRELKGQMTLYDAAPIVSNIHGYMVHWVDDVMFLFSDRDWFQQCLVLIYRFKYMCTIKRSYDMLWIVFNTYILFTWRFIIFFVSLLSNCVILLSLYLFSIIQEIIIY